MDWSNVDLSEDSYERDSAILDEYTFDTVLLEINCNIKDINIKTVSDQFEEFLQNRVEEAKTIFYANLNNIVKQALKERGIK